MSRTWRELAGATGNDYAEVYRQRFADLAAQGMDVHGEADFLERLRPPPARVLDAGCGTGRVASRLHDRGYDVTGCDADETMIAAARRDRPDLDWKVCDLADPDPQLPAPFDVVLLAGNVVPLLDGGTLPAVAKSLATLIAPGGTLLAGFGLDADHLPRGCPTVSLAEVDAAMHAAGLSNFTHWADWQDNPFKDDGYVVASYRR